ncbi:MAG: NAD(P)-binding protein [Chloroflexi bacterium]|nr:NAD(P)-binding protein [Chloroflexota bacterium]
MEQNRLRELENQCIQDSAPSCIALCPVHVDIRRMTLAIVAGDFSGAHKVFRKSVPFPEIIARTCDQPCQAKCNRETLGGVIRVADLERASVEFSTEPPQKITILPKKKSRVAIIGGGLSGLTAAFDLARKGYQVDLFEEQNQLGGRLWDFSEEQLPREILERETKLIAQVGVKIHLNERVEPTHPIWDEADAIYLGIGKSASVYSFPQSVTPTTFQTSQPKVFAGGSLLHPYSSILSVSDGCRAAISIDRFLQKVSLTASRINEGAYETRLYTNLAGLASVETILPRQIRYTKEEVQAEAKRCIQCECMECVKSCEYLKHYGGYPKKYVREIYNNMSMLVRARTSNNFINSCALCGLCGEVCPTDLNMGQPIKETREKMVETSRMPASAHDFALRDMAFSNGEKFAMAKNAPIGGRGEAMLRPYNEFVYFPGCQLSGSSPDYTEKAYSFLRDTFYDVGLMLRCCGAPADWAGRKDLFAQSQAEFRAEHEKLGKPKVILTCSSCYQVFQQYYPDVEILSFWDVYDQHGQFPKREFFAPVAIHDPCSTRYESHIQDSVRSILTRMGGEIQELELSREKTECCSFGGAMWLANKPVAEKAVQRRINESPLDYVTYCAMCRNFFAKRGKRATHIFDYIFGGTEADLALVPAVGFSQNHENRARLKEKLLRELWSETMPEQAAFESIRLTLPDDVQKQVEDRLILVEDMQKVIEHAERTGKRMFNKSTQHYLAYFKPASVTYWVEYTSQADGSFLVHKAYSHRMEIGK